MSSFDVVLGVELQPFIAQLSRLLPLPDSKLDCGVASWAWVWSSAGAALAALSAQSDRRMFPKALDVLSRTLGTSSPQLHVSTLRPVGSGSGH